MKHSVLPLSIVLTLVITLFSCKEKAPKDQSKQAVTATETHEKAEDYHRDSEWNLVWTDEFNGATIDTANWNFQVVEAGRFNDEWQRYTNSSANAFVDNGALVIKAIHEGEEHGMNQYTSARLHTANKYAWKYGKIAARIKLPQGRGMWPAFWMLGANIDENGGNTPWPQSGEIDIIELYGSKDDGIVEANIHYADSTNTHAMLSAISHKLSEGKFADDFHIFALEWDAEKLTWFVDEVAFASTPITASALSEFHEEFFILLNLAVGGTYAGRPDTTTPFPQSMYVDWVRVYQK